VTQRSRLANANLRNEANKLFVFSRAWYARANFEQLLLVRSDEYFAPGLSEGVQAYKKEGSKFMQRLLAKQKTCVLREYALQTAASVDSSRITGNPDIIR